MAKSHNAEWKCKLQNTYCGRQYQCEAGEYGTPRSGSPCLGLPALWIPFLDTVHLPHRCRLPSALGQRPAWTSVLTAGRCAHAGAQRSEEPWAAARVLSGRRARVGGQRGSDTGTRATQIVYVDRAPAKSNSREELLLEGRELG